MLANRVRELTSTTGTGDITLAGALPGHISFSDAFGTGDSVIYVIEDGDNYEIGTGTLLGSATLERTSVSETLMDGAYVQAGALPIALSGNARVYCAATADFLLSPTHDADVIREVTAGAGVTADGVLLKDGGIYANSGVFTGDLTINNDRGFRVGGENDTFVGQLHNVGGLLSLTAADTRDIAIGGETGGVAITIDTSDRSTSFAGETMFAASVKLTGYTRYENSFGNTVFDVGTTDNNGLLKVYDSAGTEFFRADALAGHVTVTGSATFSDAVTLSGGLTVGGNGAFGEGVASNPTLAIGKQATDNGGQSTLQFFAKDAGADGNGFSIRYVKDASQDELRFIDGGGTSILTLQNTDNRAVFAGDLDLSGNTLFGLGDAQFTNTDSALFLNTTDGADTKRLQLCGGGLPSQGRGAYINIMGNDYLGQEGDLSLHAGAGVQGRIRMVAGGVDALIINNAQDMIASGDMYHATGAEAVGWSAGSSRDLGANILAYGQAHAGQANDMHFRAGMTNWLSWDNSALTATFTGLVTGSNTVAGGTSQSFKAWNASSDVGTTAGIVFATTTSNSFVNATIDAERLDVSARTKVSVNAYDGVALQEVANFNGADLSSTFAGSGAFVGNLTVGAGSGNVIADIAAGTTSYSSLYFSDDIQGRGQVRYNHAADTMELVTSQGVRASLNGSNLVLTSDSLVVRNTAPIIDLHDNVAATNAYINADGGILRLQSHVGQDVRLNPGGLTALTASSAGNVGIGAAPVTRRFEVTANSGQSAVAALLNTASLSSQIAFKGSSGVNDFDVRAGAVDANLFGIYTNNTLAASWDASQNATFAGNIVGGGTGYFASNVGIGVNAAYDGLHIHRAVNAYLHLSNDTTGSTAGNGTSILVEGTTSDFIVNQREALGRIRLHHTGVDVVTIGTDYTTTVAGKLTVDGGALISVMNKIDGGSSYGIRMYDTDDTSWGFIMSQSGVGKSMAGTTACTSLDGRTGFHLRSRVAGGANYGWIFEGADDDCKASVTADTGDLYTKGAMYPGGTDVYMYRVGANTLGFATAGATQWLVSNTGDLVGNSGSLIRRNLNTSTLSMSGGLSGSQGGAIILYGNAEATNANDIAFLSAGSTKLNYDASATYWNFQNNNVTGVAQLLRGADATNITVSGGTATNLGANISLWGENDVTSANDIRFRASGTEVLRWDQSANYWNFQALNQTGVTGVSRGTDTGDIRISGGSTNDTGANVVFYGETHATLANDILFRAGTTTVAQWDHGADVWSFADNTLDRVLAVYSGKPSSQINFSGGTSAALGGNIVMYGESHATLANDTVFRAGGTAWLTHDSSAGQLNVAPQTLFADGSAAAPSVSNSGDPDTGMYWIDVNAIGFSSGGAEKFRVDGGGIQSAANIRAAAGSEASPSFTFSADVDTGMFRPAADALGLVTAASERWRINATGEFIGIGGGVIRRSVSNSNIYLSGGSTTGLGSNLVLYGEAHATNANDVLLRSGTTAILQWEDASSYWNFQGYQVRNVADLYGGPDTQAMEIYGSVTTASANILLYGGTHATKAYDIHFRAGSTDALWYDNSAALWKVGVTGIVRTIATDSLWLTGGTTTALGGGIRFFGETHATNAGDIYLLSGGTVVSHWNETSGEWNQQGNPFVNVPHIHRASALNTLGLSGGSSTGAGGNIILYGESHATNAGDILFRSGTDDVLIWDDTANGWNFLQTEIVNTPIIRRAIATSTLNLSGGSTVNLGANMLLYGEEHATSANDILFKSGATERLRWDDSASSWNFLAHTLYNAGHIVSATGEIKKLTDSGTMVVSGGTGTGTGANVFFYGAAHATDANDILFRSDTTNLLRWDDSAAYWYFYSARLASVGSLDRGLATSILNVSGGSNNNSGSNIVMYGESHDTNAGDFYLRSDTAEVLHFDNSASTFNFKDNDLINLGNISGDNFFGLSAVGLKTISGGTGITFGANIQIYAESHATQAFDFVFRQNSNAVLHYDHSGSVWDFQDKDIATTGIVKGKADTTANRPAAATVGAGASMFDITLGKPIWSDGSQWVDATGTAV